MADKDSLLSYEKLEEIDFINVDIIPEKKGLFIKHVEYIVTSKRFRSEVIRRYNDFVAFHEVLLYRFPYRIVPKLPPKKIVGVFPGDLNFLENRRKSLRRWLLLLSRHPVISQDTLLHFFLTQPATDIYIKIKEIFKNIPDEFMTSEYSAKAKELAAQSNNNEFASSREQMRVIYNGVQKIKQIADQVALKTNGYSGDMEDLGSVLTELAINNENCSNSPYSGNSWIEIRKGLGIISRQFQHLTRKAHEHNLKEGENVCEKLNLLLDILTGHQELCERVEKGVSHDHQTALSKLVSLKKRQLHGFLKGSTAETVAVLENRMLEQENIIASVELRTAFSMYCVRRETSLVHTYLELLAKILNSFVTVQIAVHSELTETWKTIQPSIVDCLPNSCR